MTKRHDRRYCQTVLRFVKSDMDPTWICSRLVGQINRVVIRCSSILKRSNLTSVYTIPYNSIRATSEVCSRESSMHTERRLLSFPSIHCLGIPLLFKPSERSFSTSVPLLRDAMPDGKSLPATLPGGNILKDSEELVLGHDESYPDWLWDLEPKPKVEFNDMTYETHGKVYLKRLRREKVKAQNRYLKQTGRQIGIKEIQNIYKNLRFKIKPDE